MHSSHYQQIAVAAILAGSALATPYPPSVAAVNSEGSTKIAHFTPKHPGSGNYMPSKTGSAASPEANVERRATGDKVQNGNVANYNADNINDGVGGGSDSYTMYRGDGSTGQGWPDKSRWVSFVNMCVSPMSTCKEVYTDCVSGLTTTRTPCPTPAAGSARPTTAARKL